MAGLPSSIELGGRPRLATATAGANAAGVTSAPRPLLPATIPAGENKLVVSPGEPPTSRHDYGPFDCWAPPTCKRRTRAGRLPLPRSLSSRCLVWWLIVGRLRRRWKDRETNWNEAGTQAESRGRRFVALHAPRSFLLALRARSINKLPSSECSHVICASPRPTPTPPSPSSCPAGRPADRYSLANQFGTAPSSGVRRGGRPLSAVTLPLVRPHRPA